jgi:colicin import membrane protein
MSAVVEIRLHPDGTIDSAALSTSSGDEAFDRSVLNAVKRARVFELVADVDPVTFERQFRRVLVTFRPEGLRQ